MHITVVGSSGGGKSTLTRKISETFAVPRLEIDRLWFEAGGHDCFINGCTEEEKQLVQDRIRQGVSDFLAANEDWVVDGTYSKVQPLIADRADAVVLLRRSLLKRLFNHVVRVLKGIDRHPETSRWQDLMFTKTIFWRWWQGEHKQLDAFLMQYQNKLVVLKSFKKIVDYFDSLPDSLKRQPDTHNCARGAAEN